MNVFVTYHRRVSSV